MQKVSKAYEKDALSLLCDKAATFGKSKNETESYRSVWRQVSCHGVPVSSILTRSV